MRLIPFLIYCCTGVSLFGQQPKVGIGTPNPQKTFHVKGEIRLDTLVIDPNPGILIHNQTGDLSSLKFNGNPASFLSGTGQWVLGSQGQSLPKGTIVISDKHPNQDLLQSGFSFLGNATLGNAEIDTIETINGNSWVQLPQIGAPPPRESVKIVWGGDKLYVFDGYPSNRISYYSLESNKWYKVPSRPLENNNISKIIGISTNGKLITFGGIKNYNEITNDGFLFDPLNSSWSLISKNNAPLKRDPLYSWTGTELIVWGGFNNAGILTNTGHIYNLSTNSWREMSITNAPEARRLSESSDDIPLNLCVFTGTEFILWGGRTNNYSLLNTGAKYNVASNIWSPIATPSSQILSARNGHSVIWTGTEMIIWGGVGEPYSLLNDGAAYSPAYNGWRKISNVNAPSARSGHAAVWTGSKMIIFGGNAGGNGKIYDPITDTWSNMEPYDVDPNIGNTATFNNTVYANGELITWGNGFWPSSNWGARYIVNGKQVRRTLPVKPYFLYTKD